MVRREAQGEGAGTALLEAAEDLGRHAGLDELMLVTPLDSGGAQRFYEHLGWEPTGERVSRSGEGRGTWPEGAHGCRSCAGAPGMGDRLAHHQAILTRRA
jgi:ribosomal protein S18 acetylase RimI-like enzyme